jgi:hypothetical protein
MDQAVEEWVRRYAEVLGVPAPSEEEMNDLLRLAGTAARASARTAAPVSTWLAARAGLTPSQALAMAEELASTFPPPSEETL